MPGIHFVEYPPSPAFVLENFCPSGGERLSPEQLDQVLRQIGREAAQFGAWFSKEKDSHEARVNGVPLVVQGEDKPIPVSFVGVEAAILHTPSVKKS